MSCTPQSVVKPGASDKNERHTSCETLVMFCIRLASIPCPALSKNDQSLEASRTQRNVDPWAKSLERTSPTAAEKPLLRPLPPRVLLNSVSSTVVYVRHHQTRIAGRIAQLLACDGDCVCIVRDVELKASTWLNVGEHAHYLSTQGDQGGGTVGVPETLARCWMDRHIARADPTIGHGRETW